MTNTPGKAKEEIVRAVLRSRAEALAQTEEEDALSQSEYVDVLQFQLATERYGFELPFVAEVYPAKKVTPIPCTPPFIAGVVNIRGQILTVLDTRLLLGLAITENIDTNLIILKSGDDRLAFLVDEIIGIQSLPLPDLKPPPHSMPPAQARLIRGLTTLPLIVLDAQAILNDPDIVVDDEVAG
jgi:purine-binding chemotaxis protein CheW